MMDVVEKVRQAIQDVLCPMYQGTGTIIKWNDLAPDAVARAAILAMREPTEAMIEAYAQLVADSACYDALPAEQAMHVMIAAALQPAIDGGEG